MPAKPNNLNSVFSIIWFPLALLAIFILALPGLVLLVLYFIGRQPETNVFLQRYLNLSYNPALEIPHSNVIVQKLPYVILLLIPLVILLLYFLKLKRQPLQVPSTFLWKKSIEDLHVNSLLQLLRRNILLILQLFIWLLIFYATMGFRIYSNVSTGKHYIVMIDNSASMSARDAEGMSRLDWAKREAIKEIDASGSRDNGMVIAFNSKATTLQAYTNNKARLREAVRSIEQTQRPTRIAEALNLADSLANPLQSTEDVASRPADEKQGEERQYVPPEGVATEVFLFSDGRFPDLTAQQLAALNSKQAGNQSALGNIRMRFRSAGTLEAENVNNVGIVGLNAVRLTDKFGKISDPDILRLQVLVRISNYRPSTAVNVKLHLDVYTGGRLDQPLQSTLNVPPRKIKFSEKDRAEVVDDTPGQEDVTFTLPPMNINANPVLHARLANVKDDFTMDNEAWLAFGRPRKARVVVVTKSNLPLRAFFNQPAMDKAAKVVWFSPDELDKDAYRKQALGGDVDLVVFDRCAPKTPDDMPHANTFFIDRPPPPWERGKSRQKYPVLMVSKRNHPLLRQLTTLWDLRVESAWPFDAIKNLPEKIRDQYTQKPEEKSKKLLPQETRLIEASGNVPVIFTLPRGSYSDLVMAFPLISDSGDLVTDWPLQPSFPLFLRNVLYTLGHVNDTFRADTVKPGDTMILRPEAGVHELTIRPPAGASQKLKRGSQPYFVYADTDKLGVYRVTHDDGAHRQFTVNLLDSNESNIEPRQSFEIGDERITAGQTRQQPYDLWKWIILAAVGFLALEWFIYNRRVYV